MSSGETQAHRELKRLAFQWALEHGLPIAGCEVRVPKSGYRADVAAMSRESLSEAGVVALFECKQCRADLIRDHADEPVVRSRSVELAARVGELRAMIAVHRPDLRRGVALFAEFDEYDLAGLRHETLHALERELGVLQSKLANCVKFARLSRYHAADHLYLVTEPGIVEAHEVPVGWGWLVREDDALVLRQPPVRYRTTAELRGRWLEAVALAGTRIAQRVLPKLNL
ncbi:hypothetical protein CMV30_02570 [Nibricoccus aquaticus]|uniref:Uncharacterized protein n=1 Tax=Nibricoccus aquaticus TaxID=2576891 RepID=A0A290Q3D9_9BACT|nr:hypothetical protein [Nibricoccus aquaticus]ATC62933.1 hypothetical protein CMV30_02570 [Nibricoccus aquaticus]